MAVNQISFSLKDRIPEIKKLLPKQIEIAMLKSAIVVTNEVKVILTGERHGKEYKIPHTRVKYRASAPDEAPATRLGHLRNSYQYKVKGEGYECKAYVGSALDYSHFLEFGTSRMRPRRHLSVAFKKKKRTIINNFRNLLSETKI